MLKILIRFLYSRSGTEEDVTHLDDVLAGLVSQIDDGKLQKEIISDEKQKKVDDQKSRAEDIRKAAATTMKRKTGAVAKNL